MKHGNLQELKEVFDMKTMRLDKAAAKKNQDYLDSFKTQLALIAKFKLLDSETSKLLKLRWQNKLHLQAQKLLEKINIGKEAIELDEIRDLIEQLKFCNM